jgi:hypothetical protein
MKNLYNRNKELESTEKQAPSTDLVKELEEKQRTIDSL